MQAIVQDLLVHYEKTGKNKPSVLLVHGWGDRLETFNALVPGLCKSYKILTLDLPGFGTSQAPKAIWNLDNYAVFVADFIKKVDPDKKIWAVVGHSNGGAVAIRGIALGLLNPEKLVLLAASGVRDTSKFRRLVIKVVAKTGKASSFWLPQRTKKQLQKKLYGTVGSDMLVAPELQETFKKTVRQDIQADAGRIKLPTLLIYGDKDRATPVQSVGQKLHKRIRLSKLEVIIGADHFVHQADPNQVTKSILEFLKT